MHPTRRALLGAGLTLAAPAPAQDAAPFPARPIRLIVPFPAGGTTDLVARLLAPGMAERLGQPVVIENRGGGGGAIGAEVVARAPADGHTLLLHNVTFPTTTAALLLAGRAPHQLADFAPVSLCVTVPFVLLAAPAVEATDLRGFVAAAKSAAAAGRPFFYGSTGPGSAMNMFGEVLQRDAGLRLEHIPFRGAAPLVQELLAGRVQLGGDQLSTSLEHVRSGALRGLAIHSAQRSPALPDLPTIREQGFPNLEMEGWNGLFAPARTPPEAVAALQRAAAAAIRQPAVARRLTAIGAEAVGSDTESFARMVAAQFERIRALVGEVGLRAE